MDFYLFICKLRKSGAELCSKREFTRQDSSIDCTHEFTEVTTACTRLAQRKGRQSTGMDEGKIPASPPLAADAFWERESQFSSGMWPVRGNPCSSRWPCAHMHNTKMVQWINIAEQRAQEVATGIDKEELTVELHHSGAGQEVHILEPGVAHTYDPSAAETHPR